MNARLQSALQRLPYLFPVVSSTVVALRGDDGLDGVQDVVLVDVAQRVRQPRERVPIAVRAPHAAAHDYVVALAAEVHTKTVRFRLLGYQPLAYHQLLCNQRQVFATTEPCSNPTTASSPATVMIFSRSTLSQLLMLC